MGQTTAALLVVLVTQIFAIATVVYTYRQNRRLSAYRKKLDVSMDRTRRQLADFYGPLMLLLERAEWLRELFTHALQDDDQERAQTIFDGGLLPLNEALSLPGFGGHPRPHESAIGGCHGKAEAAAAIVHA